MDVLAQDAKGAGFGLPCFQADDDVVPARIGGLGDICTAGVGLRVRMAVGTPNNFQPISFSSQFGSQMLFRVNRVDHGAAGDVGTGHEPDDFRGCGVAYQQATHLFGVAGDAVCSHCCRCICGHGNEVLG